MAKKKVIEKEICGFKVVTKEEEEYAFIRISKDGKAIYLHFCPEIDAIFVNTVYKDDLNIKYLDGDELGIVLIGFGRG